MRKILSIGLVRGLIGQVIGTAVGFGLMMAIRAALGLSYWAEPAWVVGGVVGALGFMIALGAFNDWWRWVKGEETPEPDEIEETPGWRALSGRQLRSQSHWHPVRRPIAGPAGGWRPVCPDLPGRAGRSLACR